MRRILHFAQDSDTSGFFPQLAKRHDRSQYRMYFATLNPIAPWLRDFMESQGVTTFSCDAASRLGFPRAMLRLARFLRRERIDILHVHLFEPSFVGLWAGLFARTPLRVMTRHYSDYHTRIDKRIHVKIDQLMTALSHVVIAVSRHTAEHLIEVEKAPKAKVVVVWNGIDFDRVRASAGARERMRRELGSEDAYQLLIVARLHPEKGYEYLFGALPAIQARVRKPLKLFIAGTGPLQPKYEAQVAARGLQGVVVFLGFRNDVPDLMASSDVFVLPSVAEAFGLVLAEALYLGTAVVSTKVGGIPEIVDDGVDGILVPPGDIKALEDAIVKLLSDDALRSEMAGSGRRKVETRFSFEAMMRSYERVYTSS